MTQFAGFLASSQGMRPARSRRKTQQRLPFDRKVEALRYLSKRVLQCPEFNLLAETLINAKAAHGCKVSQRVFVIKLRLDAPAGPA
jgi:hypothetical protein